jgi:hypothetical protein
MFRRPAPYTSPKCASNVCRGTYHRTHYAIAAGSKLYIANRTGSALGISVNTQVKFAINGNTIYLMDEKGKAHDCHREQVRNVLPNQTPASVTTAERAAGIIELCIFLQANGVQPFSLRENVNAGYARLISDATPGCRESVGGTQSARFHTVTAKTRPLAEKLFKLASTH